MYTIPFCWSPSAYLYDTIDLGPLHYARLKRVPLSQYTDDRHMGQWQPLRGRKNEWSDLDLARAASFITALVLVFCGYFIGLGKSILEPVQSILFLGFFVRFSETSLLFSQTKRRKSLPHSKILLFS